MAKNTTSSTQNELTEFECQAALVRASKCTNVRNSCTRLKRLNLKQYLNMKPLLYRVLYRIPYYMYMEFV